MLLDMTREEYAFVTACIQIKSDADKEEQKKIQSKRPHKR